MDLKKWMERSLFEWDESWTDVAHAIGLNVAGLALATACNVGLDWQNPPHRALRLLGSVGAAGLTLAGARQGREICRLSSLYQSRQRARVDAARVIYQAEIDRIMNPTPGAIGAISVRTFNWQALSNRVDYPHISIEGKTGQGKSTLAEFLCTVLGGKVIAVAPHYEPGDFPTADLIVGAGRDYGQSVGKETLIDWGDILGGQVVSVVGCIKSLHQEMDQRYRGDRNACEPINVILDEYNAYAKKDGLGELIKELIRESRKVQIRLFLLCHGTEVAALGIEGEGSLRENLTRIRLGKFAKEFATTKVNRAKNNSPDHIQWLAVLESLKAEKRPALVEEEFAQIPTFDKASLPPNFQQRVLGQTATRTPDVQDVQSVQLLERCLGLPCTPDVQDVQGVQTCPKCGSLDVRTSGQTSIGKIRYRCNKCNKTWS